MHVVASNPRGEEKTKGKVGVGDCRRQKMRRPISTALDDDACRECGSPDEETEPLYERRKGRATPAHTGSDPGLKWRGLAHHRQAITATKGLGDVPRCQGGAACCCCCFAPAKKAPWSHDMLPNQGLVVPCGSSNTGLTWCLWLSPVRR